MEKPKHDKIWLRPGYWDGYATWLWCEDIAPFIDDEEDEADGPYIHVDVIRKLVQKWPESIPTDEIEKLLDAGADYQGVADLKKAE